MIWTILLILLITVASLLVIVGSLILFPVFTFGIYAVLRPGNKKLQITGSWLHPRIVTFTINPFNKDFVLIFLGWRLFGSNTAKPSSVKSENVPETESTSAQPETITRQVPHENNDVDAIEVVSSRPEAEARNNSEIQQGGDKEKVKVEVENKIEEKDKAEEQEKVEVEEEEKIEEKVEAKDKIGEKDQVKEKIEEKAKAKVNKVEAEDKAEHETVKDGFFTRLKKNRYFYMIRQRTLQKKLVRWGFRIFRSLFRIIRFDHFDASIKAGIEEPALLGNVYAFYTMTRYTVNVAGGGEPIVKFEPVFMKNWFEGEGRFSLKTSVISLVWPGLIAVTSFPYITVLWLFWKSRKLKVKREKS